MADAFIQNALTYAIRHQLRLAERLGSGFTVSSMWQKTSQRAAGPRSKHIAKAEPYLRECAVYQRLKNLAVTEILGFNVPQLIRTDDELRIVEMTVVTRPFDLDFAGAYLDAPPQFSDEIWQEWESARREQFDTRWPEVKAVLSTLEDWDIFMVDVSPSNIAFRS